jgi:hypothetical protein
MAPGPAEGRKSRGVAQGTSLEPENHPGAGHNIPAGALDEAGLARQVIPQFQPKSQVPLEDYVCPPSAFDKNFQFWRSLLRVRRRSKEMEERNRYQD